MKPQFLIAAPHSGAGKTTVTLGILRALKNQGLAVQPFKCGPDYLDPKLHAIAANRPGINLDQYMMDDFHINNLYGSYGGTADVLVTEGVMGLFDGALKMEGSSAAMAKLLNIPVILVINAKAMAYSAAAVLLGFKTLCKDIRIAGVIFNFVSNESHYNLLKEAAEDVGILPLGYLPPNSEIKIPSRHLGLQTEMETELDQIIEKAAAHIQQYINLEQLLESTSQPLKPANLPHRALLKDGKKILIAKDEAFNFTYPQNIAALESLGTVSYFSPLQSTILPEADLIYLPGGYPELYLKELAANHDMRLQLKAFYLQGGKFLAECGGMMYLGNYIADEHGQEFPMTGILDFATGMVNKKLSMGYKQVTIQSESQQIRLKGHEFHYSQFIVNSLDKGNDRVFTTQKTVAPNNQHLAPLISHKNILIRNARNEELALPVFSSKNILASYIHFYFGHNITAIEKLLFSE